jgi:hypothetical protein
VFYYIRDTLMALRAAPDFQQPERAGSMSPIAAAGAGARGKDGPAPASAAVPQSTQEYQVSCEPPSGVTGCLALRSWCRPCMMPFSRGQFAWRKCDCLKLSSWNCLSLVLDYVAGYRS